MAKNSKDNLRPVGDVEKVAIGEFSVNSDQFSVIKSVDIIGIIQCILKMGTKLFEKQKFQCTYLAEPLRGDINIKRGTAPGKKGLKSIRQPGPIIMKNEQ